MICFAKVVKKDVFCVTLPLNFQDFKNMSKDNTERNYGFKHIQPEYCWMTPGWIEELVKHEPDEEVRNYVTDILTDLTTPEKSRLESSTDAFDSIEDYWFNRLLGYNIKFEDDAVYKWLVVSMDFFAKNEAYELCYNIQRAIDIIRKQLDFIEKSPSEVNIHSDLPF